jgi:hypothetical protein
MTYKKTGTTIFAMGGTETGNYGVVPDDDVEQDIEHERAMLSERARRGAPIQTVEQARNTLVVLYENGSVKVYKWLKQ